MKVENAKRAQRLSASGSVKTARLLRGEASWSTLTPTSKSMPRSIVRRAKLFLKFLALLLRSQDERRRA